MENIRGLERANECVRFSAKADKTELEGGIGAPQASTWHVIRTKQYKERFVAQSARVTIDDIYVPFSRIRRRALGRFIERIEALFPCYIFARFRLAKSYLQLMRTPGVLGIVCVGGELAELDESVIEEIRSREKDGLIVLPTPIFQPRQPVTITEGAFRGIEAIFERYLSGPERAALLLNTIGGATVRAIVSTDKISPNTRDVA